MGLTNHWLKNRKHYAVVHYDNNISITHHLNFNEERCELNVQLNTPEIIKLYPQKITFYVKSKDTHEKLNYEFKMLSGWDLTDIKELTFLLANEKKIVVYGYRMTYNNTDTQIG